MNLQLEDERIKEKQAREAVERQKRLDMVIGVAKSFKGMRPMNDRVIVIPIPKQKRSEVLIELDEYLEQPTIGVVAAIGPGFMNEKGVREPIDLKVGVYVTYGKTAGHEFAYKGQQVLVMRESSIVAEITDPADLGIVKFNNSEDEA